MRIVTTRQLLITTSQLYHTGDNQPLENQAAIAEALRVTLSELFRLGIKV